jgi:hypothetical protein
MTVEIHTPRDCLSHPLVRALAFGLILILLAVRLGSLTEKVLVTPLEDVIFGVAFIIDAEKAPQIKLLVNKTKHQLGCLIPQVQDAVHALFSGIAIKPEHVPFFFPHELIDDIFIPPEGKLELFINWNLPVYSFDPGDVVVEDVLSGH